ncbi:MAG: hypothetical protein U1A22_11205 [Xanthomonadaceae bacterium]|nr:hypothetical protein [Xanthomonadaceae bacterium]
MNKIELSQEERIALARQAAGIVEIDDQALANIAGGCTSTCGGDFFTTRDLSCVPPGAHCP